MPELRISKEKLAKLASHSILGMLVNAGLHVPSSETLHILFQESTRQWKEKHGGPDEIIIPEYVPVCICEDVLRLVAMGHKIKIGSYQED